MSLGRKIVALFLLLGLGFCFGSYGALKLAIFPAFETFERESTEAAMSRVTQVLEADFRALKIMNIEYSRWDHTYEYALGRRPEYAEENLDPAYWQSININMMLIFDATGNLLFGTLGDPADDSTSPLGEKLRASLVAGHPLVTHREGTDSARGLLSTDAGLMQVVSYPILTSGGEGPIVGSLVIGQYLGARRVAELGQRATAQLSLYPASALSPEISTELLQDSSDADTPYFELGDASAKTYQLLRDVAGIPIAVLQVNSPRRITRIGANTIRTATMLLAAASATFLLAALLFMRRLIIAPVKNLTEQILTIRHTGVLHFETGSRRSDEIGVLAREFGELTSDLGKAKNQLEEARDNALEGSRAKSEFLARMSHEIRTPMNGVLGMTELLRNTALNDKQHRFTETIYESAESLLDIINDILDFSKIEAGKLQLDMVDVQLQTLVEETVEGLANHAHRKNLELIGTVHAGLRTSVRADPVRLRQVLTNLIGNAIKFTETGEVVVKLTSDTSEQGYVDVLFEVTDTGIGIRPEKQQEIFESFTQEDGTTTRTYGGTGLGLAICRQLVEQMGGQLEVESARGRGSRFFFTLRMQTGSDTVSAFQGRMQYVAGRRVMIVDDNATNREILESQLGNWRARTDSASSAAQALEIMWSAAASGAAHDLAILDMHMPKTNGLQLARSIREDPRLAQTKLVILSSVATPASEDELDALDIAGQLTKPVRQSHLYDALAAVMGGDTVRECRPKSRSATTRALSGKILLAEDNPVNQAVAMGMLENLGLSVEVVCDGRQAVDMLARGSFDVVMMDCLMPVLDGFKASEEIRRLEAAANRKPIPIIAVTANALKGDRELCLASGMNEYLTKPFTSEQLHSVLALFLCPARDVESAMALTPATVPASADVPPKEDSPIDAAVLEGLAQLQRPGTPSILGKVISIFIESSRGLIESLVSAVEEDDANLVREYAHSLKSSSGNVGATGLAKLCKQLEGMGRNGDLSDAVTVRLRVEKEYQRVLGALQRELASVTESTAGCVDA